jgi:hypothetical protein
LPKFIHRKYTSLVNIDVGTQLKITQQKTAKTMKKNSKKNLIPNRKFFFFSQDKTRTTGIFLDLNPDAPYFITFRGERAGT